MARRVDAREILEIARVSESVKIDDMNVRLLFKNYPDERGPDKSGPAGHKYCFHLENLSAKVRNEK